MLRDPKGFTLIEVMVGVTVLLVALVPLLQYLTLSARWAQTSRAELSALTLAQGKIEEIKRKPFSEVRDEPENPVSPPVPFAEDPSFTYRVGVSEVGRYLKTVTVTVYYEDTDGLKELSLTAEKGWR